MTRNFRFDGRVAVITGAARGLGYAHARLLATQGAKLVINDLGGNMTGDAAGAIGPADEATAALCDAGGICIADYSDVATPDGATALIDHALSAFGRLDILVNNAGIVKYNDFVAITPTQFQRMLMVHAGGHFFTTQAAWPHMQKQGYGRIVMTTSGASLFGMSGNADYACGKGAVLGLTKCLVQEAGASGIKINAVAPNAMTRMASIVANTELGQQIAAHLAPEKVSPLVAWLCHESCTLNGEVFDAGGGHVRRVFIAETVGMADPNLSIESIAAAMPAILEESCYTVPPDLQSTTMRMIQAG